MRWPFILNNIPSSRGYKKITKSLINLATPKMLHGWVVALLNTVEEVEHDKKTLKEKIERLEAQTRKLQGLPAKPKFDSTAKTSELDTEDDAGDDDDTPDGETTTKRKDASEKDRRKKKDLVIDKTKNLIVSPDDLDATFEYKGTRKVVVQDIIFQRENIEFELEKFYSRKHRQTVEADLSPGYDGGYFGPNIIALIKCSYYEGDITIKKFIRF